MKYYFALLYVMVLLWAQPISAAITVSAAELGVLYGTEVDEAVSKSIASAGDVDGDGYADVLIGAPGHGDSAVGVAYLVYGTAEKIDRFDLVNAAQFHGEDSGDKFGNTVAGIGDINGDGYDDLAVTSPYHDSAKHNAGTIYIVYGQATRFTSQSMTDAPRYAGIESNARIGGVLAAAGDMNADGYDDFVIGAANRHDRSGGVYLVYGQADKFTGGSVSSFILLSGDDDYDYAGSAVVGAADLNADGLADLLISASKHDVVTRDEGAIYLVYGQANKFSSQSLANFPTISGTTTSERIGQSLTATDLNNDTFADIIIGAAYNDTSASNAGAVYLVYTSSARVGNMSVSAAIQLYDTTEDDVAGTALAAVGDITNDGYNDVIVGAPSTSDVEAGSVYIVPGSTTLLAKQPLTNFDRITGETIGDRFGADLAAAGDMNGDKRPEGLIGATNYDQGGATYIMYWPIPTCANSAAIGGILADYPITDWKHRMYRANDKLRIVVERKGQQAHLVNCKTDSIEQTLTFNTKAQRKILARVFEARQQPVFIVVTRTYSRRKIKVFFYKQESYQLTQLDGFTTKWRPRGLRIKVHRKNKVILQKGKEKKHRLVYWINLDMKLQRL